jgi:hypothetical protein
MREIIHGYQCQFVQFPISASNTPLSLLPNVHPFVLGPLGHFLVQWTADPHAGFTTGTPWMRVNDDYAQGWNVQAQLGDDASVHAFYKHVLAYRKNSHLLVRSTIQSFHDRI